jgi:hypothetical protein
LWNQFQIPPLFNSYVSFQLFSLQLFHSLCLSSLKVSTCFSIPFLFDNLISYSDLFIFVWNVIVSQSLLLLLLFGMIFDNLNVIVSTCFFLFDNLISEFGMAEGVKRESCYQFSLLVVESLTLLGYLTSYVCIGKSAC